MKNHHLDHWIEDEMSKLIRAADNPRDFAILMMFCKTGLRFSELCDLDLSDIDLERKEISVRHGKRDKPRRIDFDGPTERVLRTYLGAVRKSHSSPLFESQNRRRIHTKAIQTMVTKTGKRVGLNVHPHRLRHSFATAWISDESDIIIFKEYWATRISP